MSWYNLGAVVGSMGLASPINHQTCSKRVVETMAAGRLFKYNPHNIAFHTTAMLPHVPRVPAVPLP